MALLITFDDEGLFECYAVIVFLGNDALNIAGPYLNYALKTNDLF